MSVYDGVRVVFGTGLIMKTTNIQYKTEKDEGLEGGRAETYYSMFRFRCASSANGGKMRERERIFAEIYVLQKYLVCSFSQNSFSCMFSLLSTTQRSYTNNFRHHVRAQPPPKLRVRVRVCVSVCLLFCVSVQVLFAVHVVHFVLFKMNYLCFARM